MHENPTSSTLNTENNILHSHLLLCKDWTVQSVVYSLSCINILSQNPHFTVAYLLYLSHITDVGTCFPYFPVLQILYKRCTVNTPLSMGTSLLKKQPEAPFCFKYSASDLTTKMHWKSSISLSIVVLLIILQGNVLCSDILIYCGLSEIVWDSKFPRNFGAS